MLWGTTGTAASFMPGAVSPLAVGAVTMGVGGLLLFGVSWRSSIIALRDPRALRWLLVGAAGVVVYPLAFYTGMHLAGVAIGNIAALGSGPVFAAILEWAFERRRPGLLWAGCTGVAVLGIAVLAIGGRMRAAGSSDIPSGVLLGLLAGLAYATYTYAASRALRAGHPGRAVMGGMFGVGGAALLPVLVVTGGPLLASTTSLGIAAYLVVGPMVVAYLLFGYGLRGIRSSAATTITLVEPLVATVLAVIVVGERLTAAGWLGLVLVLGGVTVLAAARQPSDLP